MTTADQAQVSLLRDQLKAAHLILENVMGQTTDEQAHWMPPGTANPVGAIYAHVVYIEDTLVGMLQERAPLFAAAWQGKTGLSELPPLVRPDAAGLPDWSNWSRLVQIDLDPLRQYARAVYVATDAYLASLSDADLARILDLSTLGLGKPTLARLVSRVLIGHAWLHCGEIACLKGLQGATGYPV